MIISARFPGQTRFRRLSVVLSVRFSPGKYHDFDEASLFDNPDSGGDVVATPVRFGGDGPARFVEDVDKRRGERQADPISGFGARDAAMRYSERRA